MNFRNHIPLLTVTLGLSCFVPCVQCQDNLETYHLDEITVIADQQVRFLDDPSASVTVITREDIEALNAATITDVLNTVSSVDIRGRGTPGSQADISVRGSSIEGVLLLIDGIRVHDPQTGHYTLDLPIGLASVERIEVLSGGGAGIYGGSAPGGVINIVTAGSGNGIDVSMSGGSYGSGEGRISLSHEWEHSSALVSFRTGTSDGYCDDTDLKYTGITMSGDASSDVWRLKWNLGMLSKAFGAGEFYGPYPSSEKTSTYQGGVHLSRIIDSRQLVRLRIGSRGHDDTFTLIRTDPSYYQNLHYNRSTSIATEYITTPIPGITATAGMEIERFGITSGSLGGHGDLNSAAYVQLATERGRVSMNSGLRYDAGYRGDHVLSPVLGLAYRLTPAFTARFRTERSYRPPNYTELYYVSPANLGNPDIRAEYQASIEVGIDHRFTHGGYTITAFVAEATDVIDWIRQSGETVWCAENHGRILTEGIEAGFDRQFTAGWNIRSQATILDQSVSRRAGVESKYALNPLDRVLAASLTGPIWDALSCTLSARYEHQRNGSERIPVSMRLGWRLGTTICRLTVENLFDETYEEFPGLNAPGRWITVHLEYTR